jgi:hypothetical protein
MKTPTGILFGKGIIKNPPGGGYKIWQKWPYLVPYPRRLLRADTAVGIRALPIDDLRFEF